MLGSSGLDAIAPALAATIDHVGDWEFDGAFFSLVRKICRVDYCTMYMIRPDELINIGAIGFDGTDTARRQADLYNGGNFWRRDPVLCEAQTTNLPLLRHVDTREIKDVSFRCEIFDKTRVNERLVVAGRKNNELYMLSLLRTDRCRRFTEFEHDRVAESAGVLLSLLARHQRSTTPVAPAGHMLSSLSVINESVDSTNVGLTGRERQVCARILYGISTVGIALELGIAEESVVTYRKRAYGRLGIATRHELLLWYLSLAKQASLPH